MQLALGVDVRRGPPGRWRTDQNQQLTAVKRPIPDQHDAMQDRCFALNAITAFIAI